MDQEFAGRPAGILGEDARRVTDEDAQAFNISAARAVADVIRSTLGPKGMDKMLVSGTGRVTITNDGETLLREMTIENPAANMIVEVAQTQADEAGDGTTTVVTLAGGLLQRAETLLEQGIHPNVIVRGFDEAAEQARHEIADVATVVDHADQELLRTVAETSMTGKGGEFDKRELAALVVDAIQRVTVEDDGSNYVDLEYVQTETMTGRSVADSRLVPGTVLHEDPAHDDMPREVENARVLLTNEAIETATADVDTRIDLEDLDEYHRIADQEDATLHETVRAITDAGANVVFCQHDIDDLARYLLAMDGVLAVPNVTTKTLEFLKEVLEATIVPELDELDEADLGRGRIYRDGGDEAFFVEGTGEEAHGVTLLLRGSTDHVVDEIERTVHDALDVVSQVVVDGRVLAGGGAVEVELARRVRNEAASVSDREQFPMEAFADALERVPYLLAENAGLHPIDVIVDLRAAHDAGETHAGIDVSTGAVVDTLEAGVLEPVHAKRQAVAAATEVANVILKIDDVISAADLADHGSVADSGDGADAGGD